MKILFLDFDGVLNVLSTDYDKFGAIFHLHFVNNLKQIIDKTNAKIVISSSWRTDGLKTMQYMWQYRKLHGEVIDVTPYLANKRGYEIQQWIDKHQIEKYCIVDDDTDMLNNQLNNFVCTANNPDHPDCIDIGYGLTNICTQKAIEILNR
jgi:hypothetical protein